MTIRTYMPNAGASGVRQRLSHGFTLIELLAVLAIIMILASLVLRTAAYAQMKSKNSRVFADLTKLMAFMEEQRSFYGDYFISDYDLGNLAKNLNMKDPWGNTYGFQYFRSDNGATWVQDVETTSANSDNGSVTTANSSIRSMVQNYIVFSLGSDKKAGKKGVNDDVLDPLSPEFKKTTDKVDDYTMPHRYGHNVTEVGYGDDQVMGNVQRKQGFPL